jgi:hypothetical protein
MRLSELEPEFLKVIDDRTWQSKGVLLSEADGIFFLCPLCFKNNNGAIGTHGIICWQQHIPQSENKTGPGRWNLVGTNFDDLTFIGATSNSVLLTGPGCGAHFTVNKGEIEWN